MSILKNTLQHEIRYNMNFWEFLLKVEYGDIDINVLYDDIYNSLSNENVNTKPNFINCHKIFLHEIETLKANKLTIQQLMDNIYCKIRKMQFELRDINDSEKGIKRNPFYPEKLIGKSFSLKPYGTKDIEKITINSIKSHYYSEYYDEEWVVYDVGNQRENGFPMYRKLIENLIKYGRLIESHSIIKDTLEYKIL